MPKYLMEITPFEEFDWTINRTGWIEWNPIATALISVTCGIALWTCLELLVLVYVTFKRRTGIYFWSIIVTTIGVILQTIGYILVNFENPVPKVFIIIVCKIGWVSNVTGFAIVLWSRLHLIVHNPTILRWVLIMICVNGFLCHTPLVVLEFGVISNNRQAYIRPIEITEKIQQTIFTLQETVISSLYIYHTYKFLNVGYAAQTRKVIALLISIQVFVIVLDAGLTSFDFLEWITLKCTIHPFVYSVKLKLEFIVLNQLLNIVKRGLVPNMQNGGAIFDGNNQNGNSFRRPSVPHNRSITVSPASKESATLKRPVNTTTELAGLGSDSSSAAITVTQELSVRSSNLSTDSGSASDMVDEHNLRDVMGRPDDLVEAVEITRQEKEMDDVERQYLGRYSV